MVTAEQRQAMRELAGRLSYSGIESEVADAITALANDVDKLLNDLYRAEEKIQAIWQRAEELQQQRDQESIALNAALAALAAVPVDAIGMYVQWSEFLGNGDKDAEQARATLEHWLQRHTDWRVYTEVPKE
jgi:chromosome segregation ATPase